MQWKPLGSPFLRLIIGNREYFLLLLKCSGNQRTVEHRQQDGLGKLKTTDKTGIFLALGMIFRAAQFPPRRALNQCTEIHLPLKEQFG